jgi:hypothetical protein
LRPPGAGIESSGFVQECGDNVRARDIERNGHSPVTLSKGLREGRVKSCPAPSRRADVLVPSIRSRSADVLWCVRLVGGASPLDPMHLKSCQIDGKLLRTGDANFSTSGLKRQDNDLIGIESSGNGLDSGHTAKEVRGLTLISRPTFWSNPRRWKRWPCAIQNDICYLARADKLSSATGLFFRLESCRELDRQSDSPSQPSTLGNTPPDR